MDAGAGSTEARVPPHGDDRWRLHGQRTAPDVRRNRIYGVPRHGGAPAQRTRAPRVSRVWLGGDLPLRLRDSSSPRRWASTRTSRARPAGAGRPPASPTRAGRRRAAWSRRTPIRCAPATTPTWRIVLNGIVENHREIRRELAAEGERFAVRRMGGVQLRRWGASDVGWVRGRRRAGIARAVRRLGRRRGHGQVGRSGV